MFLKKWSIILYYEVSSNIGARSKSVDCETSLNWLQQFVLTVIFARESWFIISIKSDLQMFSNILMSLTSC